MQYNDLNSPNWYQKSENWDQKRRKSLPITDVDSGDKENG